MWAIIGFIILAIFFGMASKGKEQQRAIRNLNRNTDRLNEEWNKRISELNIDLRKTVIVKKYFKSDMADWFNYHIWATGGAIAMFLSLTKSSGVEFRKSPLEWSVDYLELPTISGVFKRDSACIIQFNTDKESLLFALEDYEKINKVYQEAKEMTNS